MMTGGTHHYAFKPIMIRYAEDAADGRASPPGSTGSTPSFGRDKDPATVGAEKKTTDPKKGNRLILHQCGAPKIAKLVYNYYN